MGPAIRVGDVRRAWREGKSGAQTGRRAMVDATIADVCRDSCACARAPRAVLSFLCMSARSTRSGARVDIDIRSQRSARADSSGYTSRSGQLSSVSAGSVQHESKASQTTSTEGDQSGGRIGLVSLGVHGAVAPPIAQPRPACSFRALTNRGGISPWTCDGPLATNIQRVQHVIGRCPHTAVHHGQATTRGLLVICVRVGAHPTTA